MTTETNSPSSASRVGACLLVAMVAIIAMNMCLILSTGHAAAHGAKRAGKVSVLAVNER